MSVATREDTLKSRFDPQSRAGFYESYFQRGNHPTRRLAFWIRYTVFAPAGRSEAARGELWAIYFDGERGVTRAVKQDVPIGECQFSRADFVVRVGDSTLQEGRLHGHAQSGSHALAWDLGFRGDAAPLLLLPPELYAASFPKAKSLVPSPLVRYHGTLEIDGERVAIEGWPGSQNHNWGTRHTDRYLWAQVSGFDDDESAFLECASARVRIGPMLSPMFTVAVLRVGGEEHRATGLVRGLRASAHAGDLDWSFSTRCDDGARITARIHAPPEAFVGLRYDNPPGGRKVCLNSKLARAELTLRRPDRAPLSLVSEHRAAFELLSDSEHPRVPLSV
jgi:hypothetical protein